MPTCLAASPLIPVSISSKINTGICKDPATSVFTHNNKRESSPPLATLRNDSKRPLLLASKRKSTSSAPDGVLLTCSICTLSLAFGMPTRCSNSVIFFSKPGITFLLPAESFSARDSAALFSLEVSSVALLISPSISSTLLIFCCSSC